MKIRDARKLGAEAQEELRRRCIKMIRNGMTHEEVALILEVGRTTVTKWWGLYQRGGVKALRSKRRGRRVGEKRVLEKDQERYLRKLIVDKTPDQLKMPFALWTRKAIEELIEREFGFSMAERTVGEYLQRWGFTPQRPKKRAYEQQPKVVQRWLKKVYPAIVKRAHDENAEIQWGDETGLSSEEARGRGYAPRGKTPVVKSPAKRFATSMISTVTNQGKLRFMVYQGSLKSDTFVKFLRRLVKDADQKVFLIVDNLRVHHAKKVSQWVEENSAYIELFYLPPYSPEHNPDEYVNQDVKAAMRRQPAPRSRDQLQGRLRSYMRGLQRRPSKIVKFFEHTDVQYAKAS